MVVCGNMKVLTLLLIQIVTSLAEKQDLSGKMFTFPEDSDTAHVLLLPDQTKSLTALTVCLRFYSDLARAQSLFSFATPDNPNDFLLYKQANGVYEVDLNGRFVLFRALGETPNYWTPVCVSWDSQNGIAQVCVNGKYSTRKGIAKGKDISGAPLILLGQEQDSYGGTFDKAQSFVGMITDVHMWDSVLTHSEIALYMGNIPLKNGGNVINWKSLDFTLKGYVIVEDQ